MKVTKQKISYQLLWKDLASDTQKIEVIGTKTDRGFVSVKFEGDVCGMELESMQAFDDFVKDISALLEKYAKQE